MRLFEYFESREDKNPKDMSETEWLPVATLQVPSGKIVVCDVEMAGYPDMYALIIEVPVSDYLVEAKVADYGADARVSRLRAMMSEAEVRLGCIIGDTWTDTGKTGLGDYDACLALGSSLTSDEMNNFLKEQIAGQFRGIVFLEKARPSILPFVESGFGDGAFPVHELVTSDGRIGVEIEFIKPGDSYPFESAPPTRHYEDLPPASN